MTASKVLLRYWNATKEMERAAAVRAARSSLAAFEHAVVRHGSLTQSWVRGAAPVAFEHYPPSDVIDRVNACQFFYHCHRDGDEHGHLHLFWHATAAGRMRRAIGGTVSPTHLFAIGLDARGLPISLFTVNQWVTDGYWFDAETTLRAVDRFRIQRRGRHAASGRWLTHFVHMYRPVIRDLIERRDRRLTRRGGSDATRRDKRLEVLSSIAIDWAADLDAMDALVPGRTSSARRTV